MKREHWYDRVDRSAGLDACWPWTGRLDRDGYGRGPASVGIHRLAWEDANGPIPRGMCVCHNCPGGDNPACCNPAHLFLGTHQDNMADAVRKGQCAGSANGRARLAEGDVVVIRQRHAAGEQKATLARAYGVSPKTIDAIVCGRTWRRVLPALERPVSNGESEVMNDEDPTDRRAAVGGNGPGNVRRACGAGLQVLEVGERA